MQRARDHPHGDHSEMSDFHFVPLSEARNVALFNNTVRLYKLELAN